MYNGVLNGWSCSGKQAWEISLYTEGMCWVDALDHFDKSAELLLFEHIYKHPYIKNMF